MNISPAIVGLTAGPRRHEVDDRWLMAYAAALGEHAPAYLDTAWPGGISAHPLFPVCYEWPLALELRALAFSDEVSLRSVHATHELVLYRAPRAGDCLATTAQIIAVEPRRPGAYVVTRFETVDASGAPVNRTDYGSIYRGVECGGEPAGSPGAREYCPAAGDGDRPADWATDVPIAPTLAHVYSECARIWNPIHTDRAIARQAGLPDIILHGTATLALAVSAVLANEAPGARPRAERVSCRFSDMVAVPSTITVMGWEVGERAGGRAIGFSVLNEAGRAAVSHGRVVLGR